jgi:flagellar FliL protein
MSDAKPATDAKGAEAEKKPKGKKKLLLMVVAILLLAGGGGGGFFWWKSRQAAVAEAAEGIEGAGGHGKEAAAEPEAEVSGALHFEPFIVNLADQGSSRYLKANIGLVVGDVEDIKHLEEDKVTMLRLRSAILEHLSQQVSEHLVTPEGKGELKKALAEQCAKVLHGHGKVVDVLFNEFVVQF